MNQQEVLTLLSKVKHDTYALGFEKIGLFGSFATSKAHAVSDVDVAIYSNKDKTGLGFVYLEKIEHFKSILKKNFKRLLMCMTLTHHIVQPLKRISKKK